MYTLSSRMGNDARLSRADEARLLKTTEDNCQAVFVWPLIRAVANVVCLTPKSDIISYIIDTTLQTANTDSTTSLQQWPVYSNHVSFSKARTSPPYLSWPHRSLPSVELRADRHSIITYIRNTFCVYLENVRSRERNSSALPLTFCQPDQSLSGYSLTVHNT